MGQRTFETTQLGQDMWVAKCDGVKGLGKTESAAIERAARKLRRQTEQGHLPQVGVFDSMYESLVEKIDDFVERGLTRRAPPGSKERDPDPNGR